MKSVPFVVALCFTATMFGERTSAAETATYSYDPLGRLVGVNRASGAITGSSVIYDYDAAGNRTAVRSGLGPSIKVSDDFTAVRGYTGQTAYPRFLGDVNGDGRQDMIAAGADATYVALAQADGSFGPTFSAIQNFNYANSWTSFDTYPRIAGDVNGDGRADMVAFAMDKVYVAFGQTNGTFGVVLKGIDGYGTVATWTSQEITPRLLGDVDGDHRADIVGIGRDAVVVSLGQADGTFGAPIAASTQFTYNSSWTSQNRYPRMLADVNGDGRADLIGFASDAVYVALGQTNGTFAPFFKGIDGYGAAVGGWTDFETFPRFVADLNHDGRADIVGFASDGAMVSLGRPDGTFMPPTTYDSPYKAVWGAQSARPRTVGDTDGDGRADFIAVDADGVYRQKVGF